MLINSFHDYFSNVLENVIYITKNDKNFDLLQIYNFFLHEIMHTRDFQKVGSCEDLICLIMRAS